MYTYKHHVIPRHEWKSRFGNLRGFNTYDNIVWLTLEQHIQVHRRMGEEGSKFDLIAYQRMSGQIGNEEATFAAGVLANTGRRHSEKQNSEHAKFMSEFMKGNKFAAGIPQTEERKQSQREFMLGKRYSLGFKHSEAQRKAKSERQRGKPQRKRTTEQKMNQSLRMTGKKRGPYRKGK